MVTILFYTLTMIDYKSLIALVCLLSLMALCIYIFTGNIKERLKQVGFVIGLTYVLFRFVADPLDRVCKNYFLGERHETGMYEGNRYEVSELIDADVEYINGNIDVKYRRSITVLHDKKTTRTLIDRTENCSRIFLKVCDSTVLAECDYLDDRPTAYFLIADSVLESISPKEFAQYDKVWRGDIIRTSRVNSEGERVTEYTRTDGKPLNIIQKALVEDTILMWVSFALCFMISLSLVIWGARREESDKDTESNEQTV